MKKEVLKKIILNYIPASGTISDLDLIHKVKLKYPSVIGPKLDSVFVSAIDDLIINRQLFPISMSSQKRIEKNCISYLYSKDENDWEQEGEFTATYTSYNMKIGNIYRYRFYKYQLEDLDILIIYTPNSDEKYMALYEYMKSAKDAIIDMKRVRKRNNRDGKIDNLFN